MTQHFTLTLELSAEDLLVLTAFLEHAQDRATGIPARMPRPLRDRLHALAAAYPADPQLEYLALAAAPSVTIADVGEADVTLATGPTGASLPRIIGLLIQLVPSCLAATMLYKPAAAPAVN
ncbi:hypothetical protein [Novosphingobium soli]|uniref:Uncharacterized protein n=1 Tax=Novosphingobium soli TaxID=574956 RepID=A0ABV6CWC7_9SPHN